MPRRAGQFQSEQFTVSHRAEPKRHHSKNPKVSTTWVGTETPALSGTRR
jgi:hypothetical protein